MAEIKPLTDDQKAFIDANKGNMLVKDIAEKINTTKYRIWNYISRMNKEKSEDTQAGFFNVNEKENWLIG